MASGLSATAATLDSNTADEKMVEEAAAKLSGNTPPSPSSSSSGGTTSLTNPAAEKAEASSFEAKQKDAAKQAASQKALEAQIKAVQDSPWTQLSNALTQEYATEETPVAAAISGSGIPAAQGAAANSALASLGLSSGSSAGQWLSQQTAAGQAQAAPVEQAMAQEGAQYQAEQKPIENALSAYGQANALSEETAPAASWLNALASHVQSNLSYYGLVPTASLSSIPSGVLNALKLSGGYGGSAGAGTTPIQNVTANAEGGSKATVPSTGSVSPASAGIIPQAGTNPAA